jgi:predicted glycoside hydrolase/deacetylase ChbG (UPF0249 family)
MKARCLIVNADDFGQSACVNRGVIVAHECGIVTSASLMVRWPAAAEAAACARACPDLSVGLHLDLGEWTCCQGEWSPLYEVVPLDDAGAVAREVERQVGAFRDLVGRAPTHLDSHQHVHLQEPVLQIARSWAGELGVPLRRFTPAVRYCGSFYGQDDEGRSLPDAVSVAVLVQILASLPDGVTELCCHPADGADLDTLYRAERIIELATLCDPRVRAALVAEGIELRSFLEVPALISELVR